MKRTPSKIRVLIADDSSVARRVIVAALADAPDIEAAASATDGAEAVERAVAGTVDIVLLDVEMPVLSGLEALKAIRRDDPLLPVILFSAFTERGARITLEGLALGANDYCAKPSGTSGPAEAIAKIRDDLVPRIRAHHQAAERRRALRARADLGPLPARTTGPERLLPEATSSPSDPPAQRTRPEVRSTPTPARANPALVEPTTRVLRPRSGGRAASGTGRGVGPLRTKARQNREQRAELIVIGSSTGGPQALMELIVQLPEDFPLPLLLVQHMPAAFTSAFAERLDRRAGLVVREAQGEEPLRPGTLLVAPGGRHLELSKHGSELHTRVTGSPPVNSCRPSIDVTLRSVEAACGGAAGVVVLTGMGRDGAAGCARLAARGASILAQDESTSVIWGMPGAVVRDGSATQVLPLSEIAAAMTSFARRAASPASAA